MKEPENDTWWWAATDGSLRIVYIEDGEVYENAAFNSGIGFELHRYCFIKEIPKPDVVKDFMTNWWDGVDKRYKESIKELKKMENPDKHISDLQVKNSEMKALLRKIRAVMKSQKTTWTAAVIAEKITEVLENGEDNGRDTTLPKKT